MPLPLVLGAIAAVAGLGGIVGGVDGGIKLKKAKDTAKNAQERHEQNIARYEEKQTESVKIMDDLGKQELTILDSFKDFSKVFEKIKNKPEFKEYSKDGVTIPAFNPDELQKVYVGAGVLLGSLGGATLGTAGGFAAAGAAYAAVMAFGTASTGTAIASLHGVALTNAVLAALGGGSLAVGGGGMALGSMMLGATTLGVGLLVGGIIFNIVGRKISNKAEEAWNQMLTAEREINSLCRYFDLLDRTANRYSDTLSKVDKVYRDRLNMLTYIVNFVGKDDWNDFTDTEKQLVENVVLLVGLLHNMCKVKLVIKDTSEESRNKVNTSEVDNNIEQANKFLDIWG